MWSWWSGWWTSKPAPSSETQARAKEEKRAHHVAFLDKLEAKRPVKKKRSHKRGPGKRKATGGVPTPSSNEGGVRHPPPTSSSSSSSRCHNRRAVHESIFDGVTEERKKRQRQKQLDRLARHRQIAMSEHRATAMTPPPPPFPCLSITRDTVIPRLPRQSCDGAHCPPSPPQSDEDVMLSMLGEQLSGTVQLTYGPIVHHCRNTQGIYETTCADYTNLFDCNRKAHKVRSLTSLYTHPAELGIWITGKGTKAACYKG